jgi:hypothetical protein
MKEKKRNKTKRYEIDMLEHAEQMIGKTKFFSCLPYSTIHNKKRNPHDNEENIMSFIEI